MRLLRLHQGRAHPQPFGGEILSEVLLLNAQLGEGRQLTNLVLMGTGEPLENTENVLKFLRMVNSEQSLHISFRNISLSTCGVVPGIRRLTEENIRLPSACPFIAQLRKSGGRSCPLPGGIPFRKLWTLSRHIIKRQAGG